MLKILAMQVVGAILAAMGLMMTVPAAKFDNPVNAILCAAAFGALIAGQWGLGDRK